MNAAADRDAAAARHRDEVDPAMVGLVDGVDAERDRRTSGVRTSERSAAAMKAAIT